MGNEKNFGFMIDEELYIEFDEDQVVGEDEDGNMFINTRVYKVLSVNGDTPDVESIAPEDMTEEMRAKVESAVNSMLEASIDASLKSLEKGEDPFMTEDGAIEIEVTEEEKDQ